MRAMAKITPLLALLFAAQSVRGEERNRFADVLALQEAIHQSIERAEPSIACILVSRSKKYRTHAPLRPKEEGRLGRFDLRGIPRTDPDYAALARLNLSDPNTVPESYGSGVVIDEREGLVLTLAHVIRDATKIYVRLPGGRGSWADIHAADPRSDLAVLRLIDRVPKLQAIKRGDGEKLRKGDFLLSLSNPFAAGFSDGSPSASWGIVSNLRRRATGMLSEIETFQRTSRLPLSCLGTLIQTDTRLNLGCSGGALLNLNGELVGLTSSLAGIAGGETPGGFAVPLSAGMRRIIEVLRRGEEVEYGFLGVTLRPDNSEPGHVVINGVLPGGPAMRGGLMGGRDGFGVGSGEVLLSVNGTPVHNNDELFLAIGMHLAGSTVRVETADSPRGAKRIHSVTLAKFPTSVDPLFGSAIASKRPKARGGLRVDWTTVTLSPGARSVPEGVYIREVLPGSAAKKAHLQPGKVIKRVNDRKVQTPTEFYREMDKAQGPIELLFSGLDGSEEQRVTIGNK